jgi:hypothetical protein
MVGVRKLQWLLVLIQLIWAMKLDARQQLDADGKILVGANRKMEDLAFLLQWAEEVWEALWGETVIDTMATRHYAQIGQS